MVRTKKRSGPAPDFKKVKQKVGGRKVAPTNETRTEFRSKHINVPQQLQRRSDGVADITDLNIADYLSKTRHHNARERRNAVEQLCRSVQRYSGNVIYAAPVTNIIRVASRLVLDDDRGVRHAVHALLRCIDFALITSFAADQLHRFVVAAMTHPSMAIRVDGIVALDVIVDVATGITSGVRDQYLSAIVAALNERTETDALNLSKGSVSAALRCCIALLTSGNIASPAIHPRQNLALLHTPDCFHVTVAPPMPLSAALITEIASALIECGVESAGGNLSSLTFCIRGLYACVRLQQLSDLVLDRIRDHILPLFDAPFADFDLKLQICYLTASLSKSLPDSMIKFLSRCLSSRSDITLPCQIMLLCDHLSASLIVSFVQALETCTPSLSAVDVCHHFFPQFSDDVRERVLNIIAQRFLSAEAVTLLLDGVRLYQTQFDAVPLLARLGTAAPTDQERIAALFGYVEFGTDALTALASVLGTISVSIAARSLLLDVVLDRRRLPTEAVLSLLMTAAVHCDDMLPPVRSALRLLEAQHSGVCCAAFDAIVRLLPTRGGFGPVRRLLAVAAVCMSYATDPKRLTEYVWSVWDDGAGRQLCEEILLADAVMPEALLAHLNQLASVNAEAFMTLLETESLRRCWLPHRESIEAIAESLRPNLNDGQRHYLEAELSIIFGNK